MGSCCSSRAARQRGVNADGPAMWMNDEWESSMPAMTMEELTKKRLEFWDTRTSGAPEMWQAIRTAIEADTVEIANVICEAAGLSPFRADKRSTFCFDERGYRYDLPDYVVTTPVNVLNAPSPAAPPEATNAADEPASDVTFRVRFSTGIADKVMRWPGSDTIDDVRRGIATEIGCNPASIRVIQGGKVLQPNAMIGTVIRENTVVQVAVARQHV
ncbi:DC-UbP/UBTD2 N-terminal domain-containing protein [Plasmodiophora brassicae]